jgi:2-keto-3-deoxy-L-rhamnonate aldolase RhmA
MGFPGQNSHPEVLARVDDIIARTRRAGKLVGLGANRVSDIEAFKAAHAKGVRFFTLAFGQVVTNATASFLKAVRG